MLVAILPALLGFAQSEPLPWLFGTWCTAPDAEGAVTCEHWAMSGFTGQLVGEGSTRRGGEVRTNERMAIELVGSSYLFHASPEGQAHADFASIEVGPQSITFENRAHDYPQRIRYWREGDMLRAEISLADGSKAERWDYRRMGS